LWQQRHHRREGFRVSNADVIAETPRSFAESACGEVIAVRVGASKAREEQLEKINGR
jgi:DnaJ-class molecular chaperone